MQIRERPYRAIHFVSQFSTLRYKLRTALATHALVLLAAVSFLVAPAAATDCASLASLPPEGHQNKLHDNYSGSGHDSGILQGTGQYSQSPAVHHSF